MCSTKPHHPGKQPQRERELGWWRGLLSALLSSSCVCMRPAEHVDKNSNAKRAARLLARAAEPSRPPLLFVNSREKYARK